MKIGVIGAGSWGTALSALLAGDVKNQVILWAFEPEVVLGVNQNHCNPLYMPQALLPKRLRASTDLKEVCEKADLLVNVVPSHHTRAVWQKAAAFVNPKAILVNASKGLEMQSGKRLSVVLSEVLPRLAPAHRVTLSGPSFAREVLEKKPTTVVIAGTDRKITERVQKIFRREWFLTYTHEDPIGVEVGGALKNVFAIAAGICDGMGLGNNTRAALITRGIYEMTKLGKAMGAHPLTFAGLTGIGDLILTCTGDLSRNRSVGLRLGKGEKLQDILGEMKNVAPPPVGGQNARFAGTTGGGVAEGIKTAAVAHALIQKYKINNPIMEEIYLILHKGKDPRKALRDLLSIDLKEELGGLLS